MNPGELYSKLKTRVRRECAATRRTRWIRFAVVAVLYTLWVFWLGSLWWLLGLLLLFDIYIVGLIPFTWWKKSKNRNVRIVMSWVDAIVYALVLVYFIFNFLGQNYMIPSSSLEKTLLTGDYLMVNKLAYGPRVPMTPVHFPLVHNTLPILGCKSYTEWPENGYKRLRGYRDVERGDIVVFNFPAGDTVLVDGVLGGENVPYYYQALDEIGRGVIESNPEYYGRKMYRPVDRRENYVKRVVALPGDRLRISNDTLYVNGKAQPFPKNVQYNYLVQMRAPLDADEFHAMGVSPGDVTTLTPTPDELAGLQQSGFLPRANDGGTFYVLPATEMILKDLENTGLVVSYVRYDRVGQTSAPGSLFPQPMARDWTLSNYGYEDGLLVPRKGMTFKMTPAGYKTYERVIRNYEGHTNSWLAPDGTVYIDGKPARWYTFAMDYYFMMGDNRDNSLDSRFWGFVPEDHIVGTPLVVVASFDKDRGLFDGKIRWNRILRSPNPDK